MKPHNILFILPLFLTILQPTISFVINGIEDPNELLSNPVSFQSSLEDSLGLKLDKFEPGNQYDINGANITVGEQEILVKADEGVNYIKFGIEAVGDKAALFGGWAPVGIIDHLPDNEKIKVVGDGNVIEIEVENNNGGLTKSVKVDLNGENVINQKDEPSVVVFVEISEEEETLQITYRDGVEKIKMVKDLRTGEETFGDVEAELVGYETDRIPGYAGIEKENQASAMIKKLSAKDLKYFENARAGAIEDEEKDTIDVIVFEREVVVLQDGDVIGSLVLEDQEVLKFMDKDEETIEVVLTPEGVKGVRGDVLLSGERIESKKAKRQLEIKIKLAEDGIEVKAEADKDDIEALKEKMMKEKKVYPRDFLVRERL